MTIDIDEQAIECSDYCTSIYDEYFIDRYDVTRIGFRWLASDSTFHLRAYFDFTDENPIELFETLCETSEDHWSGEVLGPVDFLRVYFDSRRNHIPNPDEGAAAAERSAVAMFEEAVYAACHIVNSEFLDWQKHGFIQALKLAVEECGGSAHIEITNLEGSLGFQFRVLADACLESEEFSAENRRRRDRIPVHPVVLFDTHHSDVMWFK